MLIPIPVKGVYKGVPVANLPPGYSGDMNNVRPRDTSEGRVRIGQRLALEKWGAGTQVGGASQPVVAMIVVSSTA